MARAVQVTTDMKVEQGDFNSYATVTFEAEVAFENLDIAPEDMLEHFQSALRSSLTASGYSLEGLFRPRRGIG